MRRATWNIAIVGFAGAAAFAQLGCNGCSGGTLTGTGGAGAMGVIHTGVAGAVGSAGITGDTGTAGNFGGAAGAGGFISTGSAGGPPGCAVPVPFASGPPAALGLLAPIVYPGVTFGHGLRLGVAVGDTTGDGVPDLITVDTTVIVRPNDGSGAFGDPFDASYWLGPDSSAYAVAAGDFNGDRYADVVYLHSGSAYPDVYAAVLLDDGGLLQLTEDALVGTGSGRVFILDVDRDGDQDIVVLSQTYDDKPGHIAVLLNDGGSFRLPVITSTGQGAFTMAAGDVDGDGLPDLALADYFSGGVRLFLNLGGGRFAPANTLAGGPRSIALGVGDVDGDGLPDIAIANDVDPVEDVTNLAGMRSTVSILHNLGNDVFGGTATYQVGVDVWGGVLEDLNGDGALDIAVIDANDVDAAVLYNNSDGTFASDVRLAVGGIPQELTTADLNGDGRGDLIVANEGGDTAIVLSRGAQRLAVGTNYPTGSVDPADPTYTRQPAAIAIADMNGDGRADVLVSPTLPGNVGMRLLPNLGAGIFGAANAVDVPVSATPAALAIADMNGDGKPDVVNGDTYLCVTLNGGAGTFAPARCDTGVNDGTTFSFAIGDVNRDGKLDVVSARDSSITIHLNQGSGTLADLGFFQDASWSIRDTKLADLNGDGSPDLVLANAGSTGAIGGVVVLANPGDGNFRPWLSFAAGSSPAAVAVGDFNWDGRNDIAVANVTNASCSGEQGTIDVVLSRGDGTFAPPTHYGGGGYSAIAAADIDGDGALDLVALDQIDSTRSTQMSSLNVLLNAGRGGFVGPTRYATGGTAPAMAVGDLDGDGRPDIAIASSRGIVSVLLNGPR